MRLQPIPRQKSIEPPAILPPHRGILRIHHHQFRQPLARAARILGLAQPLPDPLQRHRGGEAVADGVLARRRRLVERDGPIGELNEIDSLVHVHGEPVLIVHDVAEAVVADVAVLEVLVPQRQADGVADRAGPSRGFMHGGIGHGGAAGGFVEEVLDGGAPAGVFVCAFVDEAEEFAAVWVVLVGVGHLEV